MIAQRPALRIHLHPDMIQSVAMQDMTGTLRSAHPAGIGYRAVFAVCAAQPALRDHRQQDAQQIQDVLCR